VDPRAESKKIHHHGKFKKYLIKPTKENRPKVSIKISKRFTQLPVKESEVLSLLASKPKNFQKKFRWSV